MNPKEIRSIIAKGLEAGMTRRRFLKAAGAVGLAFLGGELNWSFGKK